MTQSDFSRKYDVTRAFICTAVKKEGVEPIGEVQGPKRMQPDYKEQDLLNAILAEYHRFYESATNKAGEWRKKAMEAKAIFAGNVRNPND